jgi:hypothetical protein
MAQFGRVRVSLQWANGGPGVNTFHFTQGTPSALDWANSADQFSDELHALFTSFKVLLLSEVTWRVEQTIDICDAATSHIVDQFTLDGPINTGTGTNTDLKSSRATQMRMTYLTDQFVGGKRLRGGTFWGPVANNLLDANGRFAQGTLEAQQNAYQSIISGPGPRLTVVHRPSSVGATDGYIGDVVAVRAMAKPAVLRSRRD